MDLRCISDKGGGGRAGVTEAAGLGGAPGQMERPGSALPEFCVQTGSESGSGQAAREQRLCKSRERASLELWH